ncbi:MAG: lysophospholipid acyltransferase family protein [Pseudomonadota bacterium]
MIYLRSILFYLGEALSTVPFTIISALVFFAPPRIRSRVIAGWAVFVVWWLKVCCGLRHEVEGLENVPSTPCVFACNHQSTWETIATQTFLPPLAWVLKKELLKIPFFGWGLWMTRPIAIDRNDRKNALDQVVEQGKDKVKENRYVLVFPEGTRTPYGEDRMYKKGGARLAIEADVPVVPIAHDAGKYWSSKSLWIKPGTIRCIIGPQISQVGKNDIELTEEIRHWIKAQPL